MLRQLLRPASHWMLAFALALAPVGCGKNDNRKPVFPVAGKVLVNKKPAGGAVVAFHPADELDNPRALRSLATAGKDGTFRLTTYLTQDGAPEGEYVVTVYWPGPVPRGAPVGEVGPDRLKGRYANPKTSPLRATVQPGRNDLPIELPGP